MGGPQRWLEVQYLVIWSIRHESVAESPAYLDGIWRDNEDMMGKV